MVSLNKAATVGTATDCGTDRRARPLQVSTTPWPGDVRLVVHVQHDAPLGFCDLHLGLGKGSKGRGSRPGDDDTLKVATLRRLADHISAYAAAYEQAAHDDAGPDVTQELA